MKRITKLTLLVLAMISIISLQNCQKVQKEEKNLNVEYINENIDPGNNFYKYANDGWMKAYPIPDDESRFGSFDLLGKETKKKVRNILEEFSRGDYEKGSIEQKIGDFYKLGMNTEQIEKQGIKPLEAEIERIKSIENKQDLQGQIAHFHKHSIGSTFRIGASADAKNSEMVIAQLAQGGLGMSDRDYYLSEDNRSVELRQAYKKYMKKIFQLAGYNENEAGEKVNTIMKIETQLAKASMSRLERRDPHKTYNKFDFKRLTKICPNIDWISYFNGLNIEAPEDINVQQPAFFKEVNKMIADESLDKWKTYFQWNLLNRSAQYLNQNFVDAQFEFYGKTLQGKKEMQPRWRRVLNTTNRALGQAIGKKFVEKHFPPEAKERMVTLVGNLREALGQRIEKLEWMSNETKEKALEKLSVMNVKIGYPDKWRDFSDIEIGTSSYFENVLASSKFNKAYQLNKIGKPVNKDEWFFPPQTVNAYYAPSMNEICFPAGILQPPFFYLDGDKAINYGAIGAVIGHEMTHGFDDQGRQYDKDGNLNSWWTKEDEEKFNNRADILVEQYNNKIVLDTVHADGKLSLGENIADLGGVSIAYTAFKNATKNETLPDKIDGYTPDQRFFLAWARVWAQNIRDKEILRRTKEDVHSLGVHRVNGPLVNVDAFYEAFNITKDDKLYIPDDKRAKIW
jgi:putative endopeptidase